MLFDMTRSTPSLPLLPFIDEAHGPMDRRTVFSVRTDVARSQRSGNTLEVDRLFCPDWVNVIALVETKDQEPHLICVRQWRFGQNTFSLEIPAGVIETDEAPQAAALRELKEETGYAPRTSSDVIRLGQSWPNAAFMNNHMHTFLVRDAVRVSEPSFDPNEEIEISFLPLAELTSAVADGRLQNAMVLVAFTLWHSQGQAGALPTSFPQFR